jgi:hypothetical protein
MATMARTPMITLMLAVPTARAISSPRKYEIPPYMPIQPMPATSAPSINRQNPP